MRVIGIMPGSIRFLGLSDGTLDRMTLDRTFGRVVDRLPRLDLLVGPVDDDAHADHRAVARVLRRRRRCVHLRYRVWPAGFTAAAPLRVRLDARTRIAKRRAVLSYRTQTGHIMDSPTGMTITHRHLAAFVRPAEQFQVLG